MTERMQFPRGFVWGVATSAYQIEGQEGGRGRSIWDRFCEQSGAVEDGSNGDVACDHYRRYAEDIALMRELGVRAYRFSVSWPRILPSGDGVPNQAGLDFYSRLVDALLNANIEPYVTLYHWELPEALESRGGWPARDTAHRFVDFARTACRRLGDRVRFWITHNEPWCQSVLGYERAVHAPGRSNFGDALGAAHHLLLSHGLCTRMLREECARDVHIGIALNLVPATPASRSAADRKASRQFDGAFNRWFLDPVFGRGYPEDVITDHVQAGRLDNAQLPFAQPGDMAVIAAPIDFLGVNYYMRAVVRSEEVDEQDNEPPTVTVAPPELHTAMGWEIYPDGLREILLRVHRDYAPVAIHVTENGAAFDDTLGSDGAIHDTRRLEFVRDHLACAHQALAAGVPLRGYFLWSLTDNFEWERGYTKRFGIVWVDYVSQRRALKDSARFYRRVIEGGGVVETRVPGTT